MTITATGHSYVDVASGTRLDVWYPAEGSEPRRSCLAERLGLIRGEVITTTIDDLGGPAADLADAYLRLHLLSRREVQPHGANMDGIFGLLTNCAWTNAGPVLPDRVDELVAAAASEGVAIHVTSVDQVAAPHWGLAAPLAIHCVGLAADEGFVHVALGGPRPSA